MANNCENCASGHEKATWHNEGERCKKHKRPTFPTWWCKDWRPVGWIKEEP